MAQEAWRAYLELAYGATEATTKKATKTVKKLVGRSAVTAEQLQSMAEDLLRTSAANREALTKLVRYELDRALGKVGLATAEEVAALTDRVHELEAQLKSVPAVPATPAAEPLPVGAEVTDAPVPSAAPARKTVAKKAVKKVAPPIVDEVSTAPAAPAVEPVTPPAPRKAPVKKSAPAKKAAAKAAVEKIAEASDVTPPAKVAKRAPRKRTEAAG